MPPGRSATHPNATPPSPDTAGSPDRASWRRAAPPCRPSPRARMARRPHRLDRLVAEDELAVPKRFRFGGRAAGDREDQIENILAHRVQRRIAQHDAARVDIHILAHPGEGLGIDRKSTRLKSSPSYATRMPSSA